MASTAGARTAFRGWDGEDEDVMQQAEEDLSRTLLLDSLTVIVSFFFFSAGTAKLPQEVSGSIIPLLVVFLAVIALAVLLQQKTVDLTKEMNPEKRGSVYDMKFQERWWESCDEAERRQIAGHLQGLYHHEQVLPLLLGRAASGEHGLSLRHSAQCPWCW